MSESSGAAREVRWGIMGCSRVARNRWIGGIRGARGGRVEAIASRDLARARAWAGELGIARSHGSYEELLADEGVEAVFIGLPNSLHREWVVRALEAGKHVLCDKPLGLNAGEARAMAAAAEANGRVLEEGYMQFVHGQYERMAGWIGQGVIGEVVMVRVGFAIVLDRPEDFRWRREMGGGALLDLGCYCVSIVRRVTGQRVRRVRGYSVMSDGGVDVTSAAILEMEGGVTAVVDCSLGHRGEQYLQVGGTRGRIWCDRPVRVTEGARLVLEGPEGRVVERLEPCDQYALRVEEVQGRIRAGAFGPCAAWEGAEVLGVLDAVRESAATGRAVSVEI